MLVAVASWRCRSHFFWKYLVVWEIMLIFAHDNVDFVIHNFTTPCRL